MDILQFAKDELDSVQLVDNNFKDACCAEKEIVDIFEQIIEMCNEWPTKWCPVHSLCRNCDKTKQTVANCTLWR